MGTWSLWESFFPSRKEADRGLPRHHGFAQHRQRYHRWKLEARLQLGCGEGPLPGPAAIELDGLVHCSGAFRLGLLQRGCRDLVPRLEIHQLGDRCGNQISDLLLAARPNFEST